MLHHLDAVQAGQAPSWSKSGNAFLVTVEPTQGLLDFHCGEDEAAQMAVVPPATG